MYLSYHSQPVESSNEDDIMIWFWGITTWHSNKNL